MTPTAKMAEDLVACEYATHIVDGNPEGEIWIGLTSGGYELLNPFYNSGGTTAQENIRREHSARRQADALEDHLEASPEHWDMMNNFRSFIYDIGEKHSEWRLDRIRWCYDQLGK